MKKIIIVGILLMSLMCCGCQPTNAKETANKPVTNSRYEIVATERLELSGTKVTDVKILTDKNTKINYLVYQELTGKYECMAMTPLLDMDGKPSKQSGDIRGRFEIMSEETRVLNGYEITDDKILIDKETKNTYLVYQETTGRTQSMAMTALLDKNGQPIKF